MRIRYTRDKRGRRNGVRMSLSMFNTFSRELVLMKTQNDLLRRTISEGRSATGELTAAGPWHQQN